MSSESKDVTIMKKRVAQIIKDQLENRTTVKRSRWAGELTEERENIAKIQRIQKASPCRRA